MWHNAVCIRCGEYKPAPVVVCPGCQFLPETAEDKARSVFCSSAIQAQQALPKLQQDIRDGKKIEMPSEVRAEQPIGAIRSASPPASPKQGLPKYEMPAPPTFGPVLTKVLSIIAAFLLAFFLKWLVKGVILGK